MNDEAIHAADAPRNPARRNFISTAGMVGTAWSSVRTQRAMPAGVLREIGGFWPSFATVFARKGRRMLHRCENGIKLVQFRVGA